MYTDKKTQEVELMEGIIIDRLGYEQAFDAVTRWLGTDKLHEIYKDLCTDLDEPLYFAIFDEMAENLTELEGPEKEEAAAVFAEKIGQKLEGRIYRLKDGAYNAAYFLETDAEIYELYDLDLSNSAAVFEKPARLLEGGLLGSFAEQVADGDTSDMFAVDFIENNTYFWDWIK